MGVEPGSAELNWYFQKWDRYIQTFDSIRDENGNYRHLPDIGGYNNQNATVMDILAVIKSVYKKHLKQKANNNGKT